jgi:arylsulfatase A-like enzyme
MITLKFSALLGPLVVLFCWFACCPAGAETPPNIILIVADDLGWADLACYGADLHETPHLDRFAAENVRFTDAYAAAPICSPTRASIMTGKYPARLHMTIWWEGSKRGPTLNRPLVTPQTVADLPHSEITLAEVLQAAGYHTWHVGKWHLGDAFHFPETHGFDANIGGTMWGAPSTYYFPFAGYFGQAQTEWRYVPDLPFGDEGDYLTDRLTDRAIELLERSGDEPFFLNLWYHTVHTPIEGKPADVEYFEDRLGPELRHQNAKYAAMVRSLDDNVGRLLASLATRGLAENTVVIFTSDNGGYVNEYGGQPVTNNRPLRSGKGSLYEGGIRVPLIVRWPGESPAGRECDEPVCTTDFYRTVLEMTGLEGDQNHNQDMDGVSLAALLRDPDLSLDRDALYFHYPHYYRTTTPVSAVRAGDWKLLEYFEDRHVELFNLADDPGEQHDLATDSLRRAADLRKKLNAWRGSIDAQLPTPR